MTIGTAVIILMVWIAVCAPKPEPVKSKEDEKYDSFVKQLLGGK